MPMSYNAWLYGYGNPVRYVDLNGKNATFPMCEGLIGATLQACKDNWITKKIEPLTVPGSDVTISPPGITWAPAVYSPAKNDSLFESQFTQDVNKNGINDDSWALFGGNTCGEASESYILQAMKGINFTYNSLVDIVNRWHDPNPDSSYFTNVRMIDDIAKAIAVYSVEDWYYRNVRHRVYDNNVPNAYHYELKKGSSVFNPKFDVITEALLIAREKDTYENQAYSNEIRTILSQGHYYVANVESDFESLGRLRTRDVSGEGNHWVTVTGMSAQWDYTNIFSKWNWIRIFNPYWNRVEYYTWEGFNASSQLFGIEIWEE